MRIDFQKMHGAGNDFIVLDGRHRPPGLSAAQIAQLADRQRGIGCDQLIVLEPSARADVTMRIFNPDGSEAGACGNATRCVADLLGQEMGRPRISIETLAGVLVGERLADGRVRVDMGPPKLGWADIPLAYAQDSLHVDLPGDPAACSMGNPHATFFVPDLAAIQPAVQGPAVQAQSVFARVPNVGFAQVLASDRMRLIVWENGAGRTLACGSGACAALVNAHRRGLTGRAADIVMDGGVLHIEWAANDHVMMTGPVAYVFRGQVDVAGG